MKRKLVYLAQAEADLVGIMDYYALEAEDIRDMFLADMEAASTQIVAFPQAWPEHDGYRRKLLTKFPYAVYFEETAPDAITILRIFHTSRRPGSWR